MSLRDFAQKSITQYSRHGPRAIPGIGADFLISAVSKLPGINRIGTNVYSKDWDILVILDACRFDLYRDVINEDADSIWSVGSSSEEWMSHTFTSSVDLSGTAYVTGNIFSQDYLDEADFHTLEEVWRYGWEDDEGTIPPRPLTNEAIRTWREADSDRMIVHYMQPHFPSIGSDIDLGGGVAQNEFGRSGVVDIWSEMRSGEIDTETAWEAYQDNLEFIWSDIELLMENVDGNVVATADHGNCFGEWGAYGHPSGLISPSLRRVPWDLYECVDEITHQPEEVSKEDTADETVEERLESLGYV